MGYQELSRMEIVEVVRHWQAGRVVYFVYSAHASRKSLEIDSRFAIGDAPLA
jgi:hypothetical protein